MAGIIRKRAIPSINPEENEDPISKQMLGAMPIPGNAPAQLGNAPGALAAPTAAPSTDELIRQARAMQQPDYEGKRKGIIRKMRLPAEEDEVPDDWEKVEGAMMPQPITGGH